MEKEIEFNKGEWLYNKRELSESIFRYSGINMNGYKTNEYYQCHFDGSIHFGESDYFTSIKNNIMKATKEQIAKTLIKVAVSKGFFLKDQLNKFEYIKEIDTLFNNDIAIYIQNSWGDLDNFNRQM